MENNRYPAAWILLFAGLKAALHLLTAQNLGFQRDELLYRALGRHLDWGYWSNPPFIGLMGWLAQQIPGPDLLATRLLPAFAGALLVWLVLDATWRLSGKGWALVFAGAGMLCSIAWLRSFMMLQPVPFDVLCWALASYGWLRYLLDEDERWWWLVGLVVGIGLLNKYNILFWGWGALIAMLVTPARRCLGTRGPWLAALMAMVCVLPNVLWQINHRFPVRTHLLELAETQLSHVEPLDFLLDQLLFHGPGVLVWLSGLFALFFMRSFHKIKAISWFYLIVLLTYFLLRGKSYYTIGAYPLLFSAGAVAMEQVIKPLWIKTLILALLVGLSALMLPVGLPVMSPEKLAAYFQQLNIEGAMRWEDGQKHELPQDYADMLGWPEIADIVDRAVALSGDPGAVIIYADNYGQAGAVEQFSKNAHAPLVVSFSDSYRLWAPPEIPGSINTLVYINDHLEEDVKALFMDIQLVDTLAVPMARERGTQVYLCRKPVVDLQAYWRQVPAT